MKTTENQKTQKPLPTEKQHLALCYAVIDLGTQQEAFAGEIKNIRKVNLQFEIPGEKAVFNPEKGPQVFTISQDYTFSLGTKGNFRKMMDSWMGASVTELDSAKIAKLLKRPAMLQIVHKASKDGQFKYANIANSGTAVFKRPADVQFPKETENPSFFFDLDNYSQATFDMIPKYLQEKIMKSPEYKAAVSGATSGAAISSGDDFEEDPF